MTSPRIGVPQLATLLALALIWAGAFLAPDASANEENPAQVQTQAEGEAEGEEEPPSELEQDLEHFESLRVERAESLELADAYASDAEGAIGDDHLALRAQALEIRLAAAKTLVEMGELIEQIDSRGENSSAQRRALSALLPPIWSAVESGYEREQAELSVMKTKLEELGDSEAAADFEPAVQRQAALGIRILGAGVDLAELSDQVALPIDAQRRWLSDRLAARARLSGSHINLAVQLAGDLADRRAAGADPAVLQSAAAAAKHRLLAAQQSLENVVELMDRLGLDATRYRQILIESTGEITVDAIDREVAGELLSRWTSGILESIAANVPSFAFQTLLFALIVSIFWGASRFVRKVVARAVEAPHLRFSQLLKRMIVSLSAGSILVLGLLIALSQLGIEVAPMLAGLGIAGFVLGFALQDTLANFAAGVMILIYRPYDVEDMIDCAGGVFGNVSQMSLVSTTILTIDNKTLIVPNSKIWGDVITNVTAQSIRRVDLEFGIGYGDDIPHAETVLTSIMADHPQVLAHPEPVVKVHSLGDSSVNFVVRPWVARDDYWDVYWDITREVKLRFDSEGVSIPFPQRDVHFYPAGAEGSLQAEGSP